MLRSACLLLALLFAVPASAQSLAPRFGAGFDALLSVASGDVLDSGLGLGVRGRASFPINADFSVALGAGFAGFILGGRDDASYLFNPQISGIVTIPRTEHWARYLIGGLGGYFPLGSSTAEGGPALHFGLGWARPLNESSLYVEVNPSLVIGESRTALVAATRVGVIF